VFMLSFLFIPTSFVSAGILSDDGIFSGIVERLFGGASEQVEKGFINSQTASVLQAAVNPDPNPSKGGGNITVDNGALVSDSGPSGTIADIEEGSKSDQISIYVVLEDDSLSQIAEMFDVSVYTIMWANDIDSRGIITPGQTLVILPVSGVEYTIKKGDTLASVAKKYKADTRSIEEFNDIPADGTLAVGKTIIIPGGSKAVARYQGTPKRSIRGSGGPDYGGYYIRPIQGGRKTQSIHGWNAVDLAVAYGTPIVAAASGTVKISRNGGWNGGYGTYIVIDHPNGTQTLYSHNSRNIVTPGQWVRQGEVIGYIGSTGRSTGPHVHFEVRGAKNPF